MSHSSPVAYPHHGRARSGYPRRPDNLVSRKLEAAGIRIGGSRRWDIRVHDPRLWKRVLAQGNLGFGEAYMDRWWDCDAIDEMIYRILIHQANQGIGKRLRHAADYLRSRLINLQSLSRAFRVGECHYDIGNELYERMLDRRLTYTCGYWQGGAGSLDEAQEQKLDLICRKLQLEPGMRMLDIGCGWGSLCRYAAENYGVECVGLTISAEQVKLGNRVCEDLPVEIRMQDYRQCEERFDRIASVGMFEHVGPKNYREFMDVAHRCLKPDGLFLLHTIGSNETYTVADPFFTRYIFPGGHLPSLRQISSASESLFVTEDLHNFGADYDRTLMCWHDNFERSWSELAASDHRYSETFRRMWRYYLLSCAAAFRARKLQLWQWVFSPTGLSGGYCRVS